ncbi:hypothetical protein NDU88_002252 [Pleurodeles waltl]|uniref:Uncharacterized protein n=1 Tax=Pleurodeles waltl TaxID=8319 RepID=A0AAV7T1U9_PLEWA|nr:hypothetical protein NDU88_002252 [Pleurodeles waltl]
MSRSPSFGGGRVSVGLDPYGMSDEQKPKVSDKEISSGKDAISCKELVQRRQSHTRPYRDACINARMAGKATRAPADARVTEVAACARAVARANREQPFPNSNRSWQ